MPLVACSNDLAVAELDRRPPPALSGRLDPTGIGLGELSKVLLLSGAFGFFGSWKRYF